MKPIKIDQNAVGKKVCLRGSESILVTAVGRFLFLGFKYDSESFYSINDDWTEYEEPKKTVLRAPASWRNKVRTEWSISSLTFKSLESVQEFYGDEFEIIFPAIGHKLEQYPE